MAGAAVALGAPAAESSQQRQAFGPRAVAYYTGEILRFQKQTWHWQRVMGVELTPRAGRRLRRLEPQQARQLAARWQRRSAQTYRQAQRPPHLNEFRCIHRYEGAWESRTGNGYYGGLQMDLSFQQTYGGYLFRTKGTADRWSPLEQIWAAERAHRSRGFWPWPNTARFCGLI